MANSMQIPIYRGGEMLSGQAANVKNNLDMSAPWRSLAAVGDEAAYMAISVMQKQRNEDISTKIFELENTYLDSEYRIQEELRNKPELVGEEYIQTYQDRLNEELQKIEDGVDDPEILERLRPSLERRIIQSVGEQGTEANTRKFDQVFNRFQNSIVLHKNIILREKDPNKRDQLIAEGGGRIRAFWAAYKDVAQHKIDKMVQDYDIEMGEAAFAVDLSTRPEQALEWIKSNRYLLSEDKRSALQEKAVTEVKRITEERHSNAFSMRLYPGDNPNNRPSIQELQDALKQGFITDSTYRIFSNQLENLQEIDKKETQLQKMMEYVGPVDPRNRDQTAIVDLKAELFLEGLAGQAVHPAQAATHLRTFSEDYGYLPTPFASIIRKANSSTDPEIARSAVYLLRELQQVPGLYSQIPDSDYGNLISLLSRIEAGELRTNPDGSDNFKDLFEESLKSLTMPKSDRAGRAQSLSNPEFMREFESRVRSAMSRELLGGSHSIRKSSDAYKDAEILGAVMALAQNNYRYNNYSPEEAITKAIASARKIYAKTQIGQPYLMKDAPELFRPTLDSKAANEEIRAQLDGIEIPDYFGSKVPLYRGKKFILKNDVLTSTREPRSWLIAVDADDDGVFETYARDTEDNYIRWTLPPYAPAENNPEEGNPEESDSKNINEAIARFRRQKEWMREGAMNSENSYLYRIPGPNGSFFGSHTPMIQMR